MLPNITNNSGIFEVTGSILAENATTIKEYFEDLLNRSDEVIMNLDRLGAIDAEGVDTLASLYKNAVKENKALYILGRHNKNIAPLFNEAKLDFILSRDVV